MNLDAPGLILIGVLVIGFAFGFVLLHVPWLIARSRDHASAGGVMALQYFGIVFPPLWLVALAWSIMGQPKPLPRRYARPAPSYAGPGNYEIWGVDGAGNDTYTVIYAASEANARAKAAQRGITVTASRAQLQGAQGEFIVVDDTAA
jgi:hypothetical protein